MEIKNRITSLFFKAMFVILLLGHATNLFAQNVEILRMQVNDVQRALLVYLRLHPWNFDVFTLPTVNDLVLAGNLPHREDIQFVNGAYRLYTPWQGEISIQANNQFIYIQIDQLPHDICQQLRLELYQHYTSPFADCQGDKEDPLNWQLKIPVNGVRLFMVLPPGDYDYKGISHQLSYYK